MKVSKLEIATWLLTVAAIAYYVYHYGWSGLAAGVLAAVLGYICVAWFGDIMPVIGPLLRRWQNNGRRE